MERRAELLAVNHRSYCVDWQEEDNGEESELMGGFSNLKRMDPALRYKNVKHLNVYKLLLF